MKPITAEDLIKEWYAEWGDSPIDAEEVLRFVNPKQRGRVDAVIDGFNKKYLVYTTYEEGVFGWQLTPKALEIIKGRQ